MTAHDDMGKRLKKKGWNERDIRRALDILSTSDKKKDSMVTFLDKIVYWILLLIAIIGNLIVAIILVPFLLSLNELALFAILCLLGSTVGLIFTLIFKDIEKIDNKNRIIPTVFIPLMSIITIYFMTIATNIFVKSTKLNVEHNPIAVSVVYAIFFILPFIIDKVTQNIEIEQPKM